MMNKNVAVELKGIAEHVAKCFSIKDREGNFNDEVFHVISIFPMSDSTATIIMEKSSGKQAAFFFYYISRGKAKGWKYFVPTDAHILGMNAFNHYKLEVERYNYKHNF